MFARHSLSIDGLPLGAVFVADRCSTRRATRRSDVARLITEDMGILARGPATRTGLASRVNCAGGWSRMV